MMFPFLTSTMVASSPRPHVVMFLVDDNGWAGVGYNNPYIVTPTIDALAKEGLTLTRHYTYQYCAPTRGAFLTGRLPYKLAATRANLIPWTLLDGIHLNYSMLPKKLAAANYESAHLGKWHQGVYTPEYTPVGRGFDSSYGFLEGGEDHNTSRTFGNWCKRNEVDLSIGRVDNASSGAPYPAVWPGCTAWTELPNVALHNYHDNRSVDIANFNPWNSHVFATAEECAMLCSDHLACAGYSWRKTDPTHTFFHHCFLISKDGGAHPAQSAFVSATCTARPTAAPASAGANAGLSTLPAVGDNGTYTGYLFSTEADRIVTKFAAKLARWKEADAKAKEAALIQSPPSLPPRLFMYYALHDTHAPLEAPWKYIAPFAAKFPTDTKRSTFAGMCLYVDEALLNLTLSLKRVKMWDDTLLIFTTDNGSPVTVGGSNHPLRGGKGSNWEGGTRTPTFLTGGWFLRTSTLLGKTHDGLIHIADWHATILTLAGLDPAAGEPHAVAPIDSINAWPWLSGVEAESSRRTMVYAHHQFANVTKAVNGTCRQIRRASDGARRCVRGAIVVDGWKLIVGPEKQPSWFGWFSPNVTDPVGKKSPIISAATCLPHVPPYGCLFNMNLSMTEHDDVASSNKPLMELLLASFDSLSDTYHPPMKNPPIDLDGYCAAVEGNQNFVGPWLRSAVPCDGACGTPF